jgi:PTS system nitrogen regulatory IIA component
LNGIRDWRFGIRQQPQRNPRAAFTNPEFRIPNFEPQIPRKTMKLSEILASERVTSGAVFTSKKKALEELARLLGKGAPSVDPSDILGSLSSREKLGSTGLGHGVAIPHGRMAGVDTSVGAFMRLKNGLDYDAHDGTPVDLVFGLLVPQNATETHLKHLAAIAEMFSDEAFCKKLRGAKDNEGLFELLSMFKPAN